MKVSRKIRRIDWFVPLMLFAAIVIDAALPAIFPRAFLNQEQLIVPHLTLYCLVTVSFYFRHHYIGVLSIVFGLVKDSYTTTILGIYATLYYLVSYLITRIKRFLPKNFFVHLMLFLIAVTLVDFCTFVFYREIGLRNIILSEFLKTRLIPTYIFNVVLALVLYFPMRSILNWLGYEDYVIV